MVLLQGCMVLCSCSRTASHESRKHSQSPHTMTTSIVTRTIRTQGTNRRARAQAQLQLRQLYITRVNLLLM